MKQSPPFRCKLPFPKEKLDDKLGELTFQRQDFLITARGEFMVSGPKGDGLFEVMFQYLDASGSKWVRIHLGQKYVDRLVFPDVEGAPVVCKDILENGLDLDMKK